MRTTSSLLGSVPTNLACVTASARFSTPELEFSAVGSTGRKRDYRQTMSIESKRDHISFACELRKIKERQTVKSTAQKRFKIIHFLLKRFYNLS